MNKENMEDGTSVEQLQNHLNRIENTYQKVLKKKIIIKLKFFEFKKIFQQKYKKKINFLKTEKFLNEFIKKFGFFFLPNNQFHSWTFFWFFNSIKMFNFNFLKILKQIIFSIVTSNGERTDRFPNSSNLMLLYASSLSFFNLLRFSNNLKKIFIIRIYSFLKKLNFDSRFPKNNLLGEIDARGFYCSLVISSLFNCLTRKFSQKIKNNLENFCSFDGGLNFSKSKESHVALSFCFLGSLAFFSNKKFSMKIHLGFKIWFQNKIKFFDFGIQGRFYKIVDSCYIFWLLSISIISSLLFPLELINSLFFCRENTFKGFSDYIGKIPDLYHTCYSICGLSLLSFLQKNK